ncbi:MAG: RNA polymerase sigma factor [Patescibacteria group bacterium]
MNNRLTQKILFLKIRNQDPEAYSQFYDLYVSRIYRFVFFKVNSVQDAQDLTSETFLKFWQYIREGRLIKNPNAFIYMVARNAVVDFYRSRTRENCSLESPEANHLLDEKADLLKQQIADSEIKDLLSGLNNLKDEYKEIIVLRFLDELSISEIAAVLKKPKGAARVLLHRALKALKESING